MILVLKKADNTSYTFSITPQVVIDSEISYQDDSTKRLETKVTWQITGYFGTNLEDALATQVDELMAFLDVDTLSQASLIDDNGSTIELLSGVNDVKIVSTSFPEGSGPQYATRRNYAFVLSAITIPNADVSTGIYTYTIEYAVEQSTLVTRTISGTVKDFADADVLVKYENLKTEQAWLSWEASNLISESYSENEDNTVCTFSIQQKKYWVANPENTTNADITTEKMVDEQGVVKYKISGFFEGTEVACQTLIDQLKSGQLVLSESTSRNDFSNRTNFSLDILGGSTDNPEIYYAAETLSIEESLNGIVFKPVLGGAAPVMQTVGKKTARATQTGILKGRSTWPASPALKWDSENLVTKSITRLPLESVTALTGYVIQYSYQYEFSTTPSF